MTKTLLIGSLTALLLCRDAGALSLDFVTVGDAGNPSDTTGFGFVASNVKIGTYEVTLNEYTEFLNAVADTDSFGLYNPAMGSDLNVAGIRQTGSSGSYSYSVMGDGRRPVTYVSWFDAARFTNWLHNGQPATGSQTAATTEQGAYALNGATSGSNFSRTGFAQFWIPSEDEWYKAAYYDPSTGGPATGDYWLYPTRSSSVPGNAPGALANQANYFRGGYSLTQTPAYSSVQNYLAAEGAYADSSSYYGTFDQGGSVFEWNEAIIGPDRGLRGGSWNDNSSYMRASSRSSLNPTEELNDVGFRVATVPEPAITSYVLMTGAALLARRKKRVA
jgi:formylglycine-generating enzyme required for sulfatase activity